MDPHRQPPEPACTLSDRARQEAFPRPGAIVHDTMIPWDLETCGTFWDYINNNSKKYSFVTFHRVSSKENPAHAGGIAEIICPV